MATLDDVIAAIKPRMHQILLYAQSSLPQHQFEAFRKLVLNELGNSGLNKDLDKLFHGGHDAER